MEKQLADSTMRRELLTLRAALNWAKHEGWITSAAYIDGLRHTAATWMAQAGVSLGQIAAYLGNSAATVERVYAHHPPTSWRRRRQRWAEKKFKEFAPYPRISMVIY